MKVLKVRIDNLKNLLGNNIYIRVILDKIKFQK